MILLGRFILIKKGELVTGEGGRASNKITNIEKWTDAFIVYFSIYASAHPTSVHGLFKYIRDVRMGAVRGMVLWNGKSMMNSLGCAGALIHLFRGQT